jgi:DNA-binding response OmpR family regulator/anti-sigma regulatory factor (Ser/Thr protein kinase)
LIKGPITRLEQEPDRGLDQEEVRMIRRNTNKVLGLVNQLLDLSRIDQGQLKINSTEGDIFKSLRTSAVSFNSHAAQRGMDYQVDIPSDALWASFDREKLDQIVYNLLSNAFKFSDDGERVGLESRFEKGKLIIRVSDTGRGIPEEKLEHIFDRFYQVDASSTKEQAGSGIGLSLSRDLVELMDGTITVASEEGKGTEFEMHIPIERIKTPLAPSADAEEMPLSAPVGTYDLTEHDTRNLPEVLLVEDNTDMRQFIKDILVSSYRVIEAQNGEEGLRKAIANTPELIITDLMMPKMDGITLCSELKTQLVTSHIPIVMLTARAGTESKIEGLETGADDYIVKPFEARELSARVKNLIAQRQRLREHYRDNQNHIDPSKVTTTSLDQRFLEQVLRLLEERHGDPAFGVADMQQALSLSKTQLNRKLKALTGESPGQLLRNFRLKRAAQLLSQEADTVSQIAYQVGFTNLSYFAKCFKAQYGVSPSSY